MRGWTVKALGLLCFSQALCLNGRTSNTLPIETARFPVVRSIGLFAYFSAIIIMASNLQYNLSRMNTHYSIPISMHQGMAPLKTMPL